MNLILAELLVSLYGIPVDFVASAQGGWKMGPGLCKATGFILTTLGNASFEGVIEYFISETSALSTRLK